MAEESGLIVAIGGWVVRRGLPPAAAWQRPRETAALRLSVNLGARELSHPDVVTTVLGAVRRDRDRPGCLYIEVTESTAMADRDSGFRALRELSLAGVCVAIDDFGTGYSSLDQLRRMPADVLKIDRSFVQGMWPTRPTAPWWPPCVAWAALSTCRLWPRGSRPTTTPPRCASSSCRIGQGFLFAPPPAARGARRAARGGAGAVGEAAARGLALAGFYALRVPEGCRSG